MRSWSPALNPLWQEGPHNLSGLSCGAAAIAEPIQPAGLLENMSSGVSHPRFILHVLPCVFFPCQSLWSSWGDHKEQRISLSLHPLADLGAHQDLAARSTRVLLSSMGWVGQTVFVIVIIYCYYFFFSCFWLYRSPNALNGDTARLYVNFKPTDKRFAFLLTSHGSFAR